MKLKKQIDDIQKKNSTIDSNIHSIDVLITRIRDIELKIEKNEKQSINDYELLTPDCQVISNDLIIFTPFFFSFQRLLFELNQNLRLPVEQAINAGKRLYAPDSAGMESGGKRRRKKKRSFFPFLSSSPRISPLSFVL